MTKSEALTFVVLLPALFLGCPPYPDESDTVLEVPITAAVYVSSNVDCYDLPNGDLWCEAAPCEPCSCISDLPEGPSVSDGSTAIDPGTRERFRWIGIRSRVPTGSRWW